MATDDVLQRRDLHPGWTRDEVLAAVRELRKAHASAHGPADEGLRERKKRLTREQISDVATLMFCERGFDNVRIAEIAAAVGVSEKTVYNYFRPRSRWSSTAPTSSRTSCGRRSANDPPGPRRPTRSSGCSSSSSSTTCSPEPWSSR